MAFKQRLLLKQVQKMIMTMKMQQSMHILQLPITELEQIIAEEISTNPVLEDLPEDQPTVSSELEPEKPKEDPDSTLELDWLNNENVWFSEFFDKNQIAQSIEKHNFQEALITQPHTLQEELLQQFRLVSTNEADIPIAEQIIGNIDENGYLKADIKEIAQTLLCPAEKVEQILKIIQDFEPAGIAARDLKECLLLQLKRQGKDSSLEAMIINDFLTDLAGKKYIKISKALKIPVDRVKKCAKKIAQLDPKPCRGYSNEAIRIIPDVILEKTASGYDIIINKKDLPELTISQLYRKILKEKKCPQETLKFIKEKFKNAQNLIDGLKQRHQTLERVARCIIEYQPEFLEKGFAALIPLTHKEIADKLDVHPSTVSRTVANKFIQTPQGTYPLKNFFSQSVQSNDENISNRKIKLAMDELIKTEPQEKPYSDQEIVGELTKKGIKISRRTVTKYRNALKIPPAHLRKK
ncbi:MAG: RNA polymerase factor sigma-54 [Candidatus Omnitrophica bacterium]|nr:RNA polymerase factor sigma-54 [Candidatus Omnitrophota bacterium]